MLRVQITKRADGGSVLRCVRADGSCTWQKQDRHAAFFALHDLTHFAVESTLGYRNGFFGLVSDGWDIDETTGKGARGRLPLEALEVEQFVGLLDAERAGGAIMNVAQLKSIGNVPDRVTDELLQAIRAKYSELIWQWRSLPPGGRLELHWEP